VAQRKGTTYSKNEYKKDSRTGQHGQQPSFLEM